MQILRAIFVLLCSDIIMSFRTFTRVPMAAARIPLRMMSDAPEIRTYVGYSLYKMKGALNIKPIPATLKIENNQKTIARDGTLLFEFAPSGKGPREYDWTKKLTFSLSPTELGEVVRMKDTDTTSFMHNPNAGGNCSFIYRHVFFNAYEFV